MLFRSNDTATTEIYTLSLHDALPILRYMYKPSKDGSSPNAWTSTIGNLDVHYSSGPHNRMFYFLSQGSSRPISASLRLTPLGTTSSSRTYWLVPAS